jgi:hypothetical protein
MHIGDKQMDVLKSAWSKIVTDQMEENRDKALRRQKEREQKEMPKVKTLQDIINDFVKNIDLMDDGQLEAVSHIVETEIMERAFARNPKLLRSEEH